MIRQILGWAVALALILSPVRVHAAAALTTGSLKTIASSSEFRDIQLLLSDVSDSIAGSDPTSSGEVVETGDWTAAVPARGWKIATLYVNEYGTGSISVSLWDCRLSGAVDVISGVAQVAVEVPTAAPSAADPDPICTRLTSGVDGVDADDNGGDQVHVHSSTLNFLVAVVDTCTGNCDAVIGLQLTK